MMMRSEIIRELKQYFTIEELVCPHTFARFGEGAWVFFPTHFLEQLLILRRDVLGVPLTCNSYKSNLTQRGLRCNICELVKGATNRNRNYLSAHILGCGVDLTSSEMTAEEMRRRVKERQHLFTHPVRVEKDVSWLHFDVYDNLRGKLEEFNG